MEQFLMAVTVQGATIDRFILFAENAQDAIRQAQDRQGQIIGRHRETDDDPPLSQPSDVSDIRYHARPLTEYLDKLRMRWSGLSDWEPSNGKDFCGLCGHEFEEEDIDGGRCTFCFSMILPKEAKST